MLTASKIAVFSKRLFFFEKQKRKGESEEVMARKKSVDSDHKEIRR